MVYKSSSFANQAWIRPSDDVDPNYKNDNPEWLLGWAKYIYGQYLRGYTAISVTEQDKIRNLRDYAAGQQSPEIYKRLLLGEKTAPTSTDDNYGNLLGAREGLYSINFDEIFSPAPKYLANIYGMLNQSEHDLIVEAIDENSSTLRDQMKFQLLVDGEYKTFIEWVQTTMNLPMEPPKPLPKNVEELEMFSKMGSFKLGYEISMGNALRYTEEISGDQEVKRGVVPDLLTIGKSAALVYSDEGVVKYQYADVADLILESSKRENNSDATYAGLQEYYTIAQLRYETGLPEERLEQIASQFKSAFDNSQLYANETRDAIGYDSFKVPVLKVFVKTVDSTYTTKHKDGRQFQEPYKRNGTRPPKVFDTENRKTTKDSVRRIYEAKWIIGTDILFNYGVSKDIPFDFSTKDVRLPIIYFKTKGKSLVAQMVPILDQIQLNYLAYQNTMAKTPPPGLAIEISSLEGITIGNKKIHPLDLLTIRTQTGNVLYRLAPPQPGVPIGVQKPIEALQSLLPNAVAGHVTAFQMWYGELERLTGISQTAVGSGDPNSGLGVSQINIAMTNNTLRPVLDGWVSLKCGIGTYSANKIQSNIVNSSDSPYKDILGMAQYSAIKSAGKYPPASWGVFVKPRLDQALKNEVLTAAKGALNVGRNGVAVLTFSDYLYIVSVLNDGGSPDAVRAFIAYKEQKAEEMATEKANQAQMLQGQVAQQTNQQKAQMEAQAQMEQVKMEIAKLDREYMLKAQLAQQEHQNRMKELALQAKFTQMETEEPEETMT